MCFSVMQVLGWCKCLSTDVRGGFWYVENHRLAEIRSGSKIFPWSWVGEDMNQQHTVSGHSGLVVRIRSFPNKVCNDIIETGRATPVPDSWFLCGLINTMNKSTIIMSFLFLELTVGWKSFVQVQGRLGAWRCYNWGFNKIYWIKLSLSDTTCRLTFWVCSHECQAFWTFGFCAADKPLTKLGVTYRHLGYIFSFPRTPHAIRI